MRMNKILSTLIILLVCTLLCSCSKTEDHVVKIVTDPAGDRVEIPDEITGIIARVNTASYVAAMGKADLIKATYKYMANDKWSSYMYPELAEAANLTGGPTAETFYDLNANLCIWSDRAQNESLREQGISAITDKPEDMPLTVSLIADIFQKQEWAEKWTAYYISTLEEIEKRTSGITDKQNVYYVHGAGNQGIYHTAAGGTISETWIHESGCKYAAEGTVGFGIDITPEELLNMNPEVIVIGGIYYQAMEDTLYSDPFLAEIDAVKNQRIYNVPVGLIPWDQYGVEYPLLCLWTAKTVYPDLFADINLVEETQRFYEEYCGVTLTQQEVEYMLEGKAPDGGSLLNE